MKLSVAVLMLLMLGALGEVVQDFSKCKQFFLGGVPPVFTSTSVQYKKICQRYQNVYRYATLYDTGRKVPVYSAYQYTRGSDCTVKRPKKTWTIEPQLEDSKSDERDMASQNSKTLQYQATNSDYDDASGYDRGHLFPVCHSSSDSAAESTFTLTNAAPQKHGFNVKWYRNVEKEVRIALEATESSGRKKCPRAYVVTGVVPSDDSIGDGVNVPSHFWSAYSCCDNNNKNCEFGGYIMEREADDASEYKTGHIVQFHKDLKDLYKRIKEIKVFKEDIFPLPEPEPGSAPSKKRKTG